MNILPQLLELQQQLDHHRMMMNQQLEHQQMMVQHMVHHHQMMEAGVGLPEKNEERDASMYGPETTQTKKYIEEVEADITRSSEECDSEIAHIKKYIEEARKRIQRNHGEFEQRFREMWNR